MTESQAHTANPSEVESLNYDFDENQRRHEVPGKKSSVWTLLRPQSKDGLFHIILNSQDLIESVKMWLYQGDDVEHFLIDFIQLIVDVASYQFIDVKDFIHYYELKDLVTLLEETENNAINETNTYFLKCTSKSYVNKHEKVGNFIIYMTKEFGLNHNMFGTCYSFPENCYRVLKKMCKSKRRSIRHTGFFISVKYLSGSVELLYELNQKKKQYSYDLQQVKDKEERERIQAEYNNCGMIVCRVEKYIKHVFSIIRDENVLEDSALNKLKINFSKEMKVWILKFPDVIIQIDITRVFIRFLQNYDKEVRLTALTEFGRILEKLYEHVAEDCTEIVKAIYDRVYDVDMKISTVAVEILTFLYDRQPDWISNDMRDNILARVYCYDYMLASACGKFLINILKVTSADVIYLIEQLIKFEMASNNKGICDRTPLLVEAVLDVVPAFQDLKVYDNFLHKKELQEDALNVYIKIVSEVVHQLITGSCSYTRTKSPKRTYSVETLTICNTLEDIILTLRTKRVSDPLILNPILFVYKKYIIDNNFSITGSNLVSVSSFRQQSPSYD